MRSEEFRDLRSAIEKAANKQITLSGNTFAAADMNNNNKIDSRDYQNAVNKALSE